MDGIDSFILNNFIALDSTFTSCVNIIVHGYELLEKTRKYSRKEIQDKTSKVRGKKPKKFELEDYLRNDLVTNFIEPNRRIFGLNNYLFILGSDEIKNNIRTGILDIKVMSPLLDGSVYYIFECKRLNNDILNKYVTDGIIRFISGQYYPDYKNSIAGMISFLEYSNINKKIDIKNAFLKIENVLKKYHNEITISINLERYNLICEGFNFIENYQYIFRSQHINSINEPIDVYHIVLDFNHLITD